MAPISPFNSRVFSRMSASVEASKYSVLLLRAENAEIFVVLVVMVEVFDIGACRGGVRRRRGGVAGCGQACNGEESGEAGKRAHITSYSAWTACRACPWSSAAWRRGFP